MILKRSVPACLLLLVLAGGAAAPAAEPAPPLPVQTCIALAQGLVKGALADPGQVLATDQGCQFTGPLIKLSPVQNWAIESLSISGLSGWDRKASPLPAHIVVSAKGIRFAPKTDNSHLRYQIALTQHPFDARLDVGFDATTRQVTIHEIAIESPWIGHLGLSAEASYRADQDTHPGRGLPALPALQMAHTRLVLDNRTLFESMLMPMIIAFVPQDQDPAEAFPRWQKKTEARLHEVPEHLLDKASRAALIRFIRDFPHPTGHFDFDVRLDHPLSPEEIKAQGDPAAMLKNAKITVIYQPLPLPGK